MEMTSRQRCEIGAQKKDGKVRFVGIREKYTELIDEATKNDFFQSINSEL